MGSIRYGTRVGSISPPPPGVGPCYRSQCCWPNALGDIPGDFSWTSTLPNSSINNYDIVSYANKMKFEKATSELSRQAAVRDQWLFSNKFLLKGKLRRCALGRPQVFERLNNYEEDDILNNLDRLPRFRFGGNRANHKVREFEKGNDKQRLKDVTERFRRSPAVPPRTKKNYLSHKPPLKTDEQNSVPIRPIPSRSASFSLVEYSPDERKYIRRNDDLSPSSEINNLHRRDTATLPRSKNDSQREELTKQQQQQQQPNLNSMALESSEKDIPESVLLPKKSEENLENTSKLNELQAGISRLSSADSIEDKKFKSKRRKGVYLSQWSAFGDPSDTIIPQFVEDGDFSSLDHSNNINTYSDSVKNCTMENKLNDLSQWSSPQEEPLSPEENNAPPEWPNRYKSRPFYQFERTNSTESHSRETSLQRLDSFSEDEPDSERKSDQISLLYSDVSDIDGKVAPKRYTKRPLRGPYGQMLEAEMKKPEVGMKNNYDLNFLNDISPTNYSNFATRSSSMKLDNEFKPKHSKRDTSSKSYDENQLKSCYNSISDEQRTSQPKRKVSADNFVVDRQQLVNHHRTISSPSNFENLNHPVVSNKLLTQLLQGSSEQLAILATKEKLLNDTRTHVLVELYDNERNYVESLQILMTKYLEPLKSQEFASLLDSTLVDEVFNQIPFLLTHHKNFLEELKFRLEQWDVNQKIGDLFIEFISKPSLMDSYTSYVNNWKRARDIIKTTQQTKVPFAKFLENTAREHRGKLALDSLLIKPIQRFPRYELLLQRLIKHTDVDHVDHSLLLVAQKELHEQTLKINCTERETLQLDLLREIEGLIEGLMDLVSMDRHYLRHDLVSMTGGIGTRKERGLLLFSDLLLITSIKRRGGAIKKPVPTCDRTGITTTLEANKYKLLMKIPLEDLEISKPKDENVRQMMIEMENMNEDLSILNQIGEMSASLHCSHFQLDEVVREMLSSLNKHLGEQQSCESQLSYLDLNLSTPNGIEHISILFPTPDKRAIWEETFTETKNKLVIAGVKKPVPELVATVPIRKTRAGLQFTCAAPTIDDPVKNVWVCNSDGYVGQVCVLSFQPEPTVSSCNGVCNAKILCIASIPANNDRVPSPTTDNIQTVQSLDHKIKFDSSSSSEEDDKSDNEYYQEPHHQAMNSTDASSVDLEDTDHLRPTMWLGTEDGCIHVYNSTDNIRIKKNKMKIQHNSSVLSIIYMDNRVFVSLANGDVIVYDRDSVGAWSINSPIAVQVGTISSPVLKLIANEGRLWCNCGHSVKVLNTHTLVTENVFFINSENNKPISSIVVSGNNVWLSIQNSAVVKCYNSKNFEFVCEVNVAAAVTKMLTSCDDIIRQHKAACLRVTSLLACKDLIWIGTSAGVLLTMPIQAANNTNCTNLPTIAGVSHGHTGHARFLTHVEIQSNVPEVPHRHIFKRISDQRNCTKSLVISGGDGYEDFRTSNISEVAGREDSTNHLLLWSV